MKLLPGAGGVSMADLYIFLCTSKAIGIFKYDCMACNQRALKWSFRAADEKKPISKINQILRLRGAQSFQKNFRIIKLISYQVYTQILFWSIYIRPIKKSYNFWQTFVLEWVTSYIMFKLFVYCTVQAWI